MCAVDIDFGLGLRPEHYEEIAANPGQVSWFEALSENYMVPGGSPLRWLDRLRRDYPMALHGVSLSIRSTGVISTSSRRWPSACSRCGSPTISASPACAARTCTTSCRCPTPRKH